MKWLVFYCHVSFWGSNSKSSAQKFQWDWKMNFLLGVGLYICRGDLLVSGSVSHCTRWAPTSYKKGYSSTYRDYNSSYPFIRFIGVSIAFINGRGPPCKPFFSLYQLVHRDSHHRSYLHNPHKSLNSGLGIIGNLPR